VEEYGEGASPSAADEGLARVISNLTWVRARAQAENAFGAF